MKRQFIAALAIAITLAGCTSAGYNVETKQIYYSNKLFSKQIGKIRVKAPDGTDIQIEGVKSDANAIVEATHDLIKTAAVLGSKSAVP